LYYNKNSSVSSDSFLLFQSANRELDDARLRVSALEADLSNSSQSYADAVAESKSASLSASEQLTKLRLDLAAAQAAQKTAEASIKDLQVFSERSNFYFHAHFCCSGSARKQERGGRIFEGNDISSGGCNDAIQRTKPSCTRPACGRRET